MWWVSERKFNAVKTQDLGREKSWQVQGQKSSMGLESRSRKTPASIKGGKSRASGPHREWYRKIILIGEWTNNLCFFRESSGC